jgi:hypothetical protein
VIKPQPDNFTGNLKLINSMVYNYDSEDRQRPVDPVKCPYQIGQTLWVRETAVYEKYGALWYPKDWFDCADVSVQYMTEKTKYYFQIVGEEKKNFKPGKKPSIFMPRWAARIFLEVTNVRVERLQDIRGSDPFAEGIKLEGLAPASLTWQWNKAEKLFNILWDSINVKRGYLWKSNPYVWVIEFKKK